MGHFYFVRHGQTVWNVENKICGATDIALTEKGHQQAIETGHEILRQGIQADEILYSPLMRAADTAKHISEITGIPARTNPLPATVRNSRKQSSSSSPDMTAGNPCCIWHRGSTISSTRSKQNPITKPISSWHTTGFPG